MIVLVWILYLNRWYSSYCRPRRRLARQKSLSHAHVTHLSCSRVDVCFCFILFKNWLSILRYPVFVLHSSTHPITFFTRRCIYFASQPIARSWLMTTRSKKYTSQSTDRLVIIMYHAPIMQSINRSINQSTNQSIQSILSKQVCLLMTKIS